ncbi:DUF3967 domain-containing protein [Bacillus cereus group sp. BfR-BA-01312]|uniref:DUF3967 domain-containing protein n=1 Tax=unclassified Bacillus cereus group TaxID=2750818 RepID=UPI001F5A2C3E|nr:DUF3967 domain-containing protein [Bacillus cereus group sp. BfR-BA-01312]
MHIVSLGESQEKSYSTAEVAKKLGIATETLRKYNTLFYAHDIRFTKEKGKIRYSEQDLELMQQLQMLHAKSGMALVDCVAEVTKHVLKETDVITAEPSHTPVELQQLQQQVQLLEKDREQFREELSSLKTYIDEKLEKRDQQLMETVREMQEQKGILLEIKATQKKKWWQFWLK